MLTYGLPEVRSEPVADDLVLQVYAPMSLQRLA